LLYNPPLIYTRDCTGTGLTKSAQEPNGIKLACELLVYQLLTQFLSGFDHVRKARGSPLPDARLCAIGALWIYHQSY
jgi:hypothetical protein